MLAVVEETPPGSTEAAAPSLDDRLGRCWAAGDLRDLAAGALCLSHRAHRDGRPWLDASEGEPGLVVGRQARFSLRPHGAPAPAIATPTLHPFGAATATALTAAIEAGDEGGDGPCRAVLVAHNARQLALRKQQAVLQIISDAPETPGCTCNSTP